jgi:ATP/maltotriose-dependent transcriptional regulator MalT
MHELLRQFAAERLAAEPEAWAAVHRRHCSYFAGFLARREASLKGDDQVATLAEVADELDNVRAAWRWAVDDGLEDQIRDLMGGLHIFYQARSLFREGAQAFDVAVEHFQGQDSALLPALRLLQAWFYASAMDQNKLRALVDEGVAGLRAAGTGSTLAMALAAASWLGIEEAAPPAPGLPELYKDNLAAFRRAGDLWGEAWSLYSLGSLAWAAHRDDQARDLLQASRDSFVTRGDLWGSTYALHNLGLVLSRLGDYRGAAAVFQQSLRACRQVGDRGGEAFSLHHLGLVLGLREEHGLSMRYLADALRVALEINEQEGAVWHLYEMALALIRLGRHAQAVEILAQLSQLVEQGYELDTIESTLAEAAARLPADVAAGARSRGEAAGLESLAASLIAEFLLTGEARPAPATGDGQPLVEPLSPREREVLALLAAGHSNRDIARELVVTVGTVKKHTHNIYGKLQAASRTQAIARARALGLVD